MKEENVQLSLYSIILKNIVKFQLCRNCCCYTPWLSGSPRKDRKRNFSWIISTQTSRITTSGRIDTSFVNSLVLSIFLVTISNFFLSNWKKKHFYFKKIDFWKKNFWRKMSFEFFQSMLSLGYLKKYTNKYKYIYVTEELYYIDIDKTKNL